MSETFHRVEGLADIRGCKIRLVHVHRLIWQCRYGLTIAEIARDVNEDIGHDYAKRSYRRDVHVLCVLGVVVEGKDEFGRFRYYPSSHPPTTIVNRPRELASGKYGRRTVRIERSETPQNGSQSPFPVS